MKKSKTDRIFYKLEREKIWMEQNGRCFYCKSKLKKTELTLDHVIPLKKIGNCHSFKNTVVSCVECNRAKGHKDTFSADYITIKINESIDRIEQRVMKAIWKLDLNGCQSFRKWSKFQKKNGNIR